MKIHPRSGPRQIAAAVGKAMRRVGIRAVLTGGACASIHSRGAYRSVDLDFILQGPAPPDSVRRAMLEIGFELKGNQFFHPRSVYYVEFPPGPLAIGNDYSVQPIILPVPGGALLGLSATDSCRDRLAAYFHFHDRQGLRAAIAIAVRNRVDLGVIRSWSIVERSLEKFELFVQEVDRVRRRRRTKRRPAQSRSAKRSRK